MPFGSEVDLDPGDIVLDEDPALNLGQVASSMLMTIILTFVNICSLWKF